MMFKRTLANEMRRYFVYFLFLALLLSAFTDYERLLLAGTGYNYFPYGYSIIEAMILAKIIILGEMFKLGERFSNRSLWVPVIYKTIIFSFLIILFSILEHFIRGMLKDESLIEIYYHFSQYNIYVILSRTFIIFIVFILFFSFLELGRVLGAGKLFDLFFRRKLLPPNALNND